jgi:hypothetical protein
MEDQVPRLVKFKADHPDIWIGHPSRGQPLWIAKRDGQVLHSSFDLRRFLDKLEELTDE